MATIEIIDDGVLYRGAENEPHLRNAYWATVVECSDGRLVAALDICHHMNSRDARSYYTFSDDRGTSWSPPKIIWDGADWSHPVHTTCRISKTPDGQIVGFMGIKNRSDLEQPHTNPETGGMVAMEHAVVRWDAAAEAWTAPEMVHRPIDWPCYESCHWIFAVSPDKWLLPTAFRLNWQGQCPHGHKAFTFVTRNGGKNWPEMVDVFDLGSQDTTCWEQKQTYLSDGRILAVCWAFNARTKENLRNHYTFSNDDGDSYGQARESPLRGQTCTPIGLKENHILCVYRRLDKKGLWAHLARIEENNWIPVTEQLIWGGDVDALGDHLDSSIQNQKKLQFGFPCCIQLANKEIFLVFWCVENGLSNIHWYRLKVAI